MLVVILTYIANGWGVQLSHDLITAQNPGAVAKAVEVLVTKLGLKVQARKLFKDEAILALISQARDSGAYLIDVAMNSSPELYMVFIATALLRQQIDRA